MAIVRMVLVGLERALARRLGGAVEPGPDSRRATGLSGVPCGRDGVVSRAGR